MTGPYKLVFVLVSFIVLMCGILVFGQHRYNQGDAAATLRDSVVIEKLKGDAATTLAAETERVRKAEQALRDFKDNQELKDADNRKIVQALADRVRSLIGDAGRLRDPNAPRCGGGGGGATGQAAEGSGDRPADGTQTGGLLSAELSGLLAKLTHEADVINDAYISCRATEMSAPE
jgi:hypothetical protein